MSSILCIFDIICKTTILSMKKLFFLFILLFPLLGFAKTTPEILLDKIDSDGFRIINCSSMTVGKWTDRISTSLSLSCIQVGDSATYYLTIKMVSALPLNIRQGSALVLRFGDNEVAQLSTGIEYSDNIGDYNAYAKVSYYTIYPSYQLSDYILEKITRFGIRKFRIETVLKNIDREMDNDKLRDLAIFLREEYRLIQNQIDNKANDIMEGF